MVAIDFWEMQKKKKERKNRLDTWAPKCLWEDKCTIRSASSQAACTSCLIPESDTLTPFPPALPLSLLLNLCSIVRWRTPHRHQQDRLSKFGFQGFVHPHFCSVQTDTCDSNALKCVLLNSSQVCPEERWDPEELKHEKGWQIIQKMRCLLQNCG